MPNYINVDSVPEAEVDVLSSITNGIHLANLKPYVVEHPVKIGNAV